MSNLQPLAVKIAKQYSLPVQTFLRLVKHESGWQPNVVSKMGAQGLTQLMPATAASLGVSNPFDPQQNLDGGARYLRQQFDKFGSWRLALAAYNAGPGNVESGEWRRFKETQRYVASILGPQADDEVSPTGGVSNDGNSNATKPAALTPVPLTARSLVAFSDPLWGTDQLAKTAFENLGKIAQGWRPSSLMAGLVDASQRQSAYDAQARAPQVTQATPASGRPSTASPSPVPSGTTTAPSRGKGKVTLLPGADRQGYKIHQGVLDFVQRISAQHGAPLTITTGTAHNQYVIHTHRQSKHWTGDAADLLYGHGTGPHDVDPALTKLGQDALIAAGMAPGLARKQQGGVYNLGGFQVIFNSMEGGNHYNHLHVGLRG